jgi:hypothetical protein
MPTQNTLAVQPRVESLRFTLLFVAIQIALVQPKAARPRRLLTTKPRKEDEEEPTKEAYIPPLPAPHVTEFRVWRSRRAIKTGSTSLRIRNRGREERFISAGLGPAAHLFLGPLNHLSKLLIGLDASDGWERGLIPLPNL